MNCRFLTTEDAIAAIRLHADIFAQKWDGAQIARFLAQDNIVAIGAFDENQLVGFVLVQNLLPEAEILTLCVALSYQRQGVATYIMQELFDFLQENGVEKVFLEVAANNKAAQDLYKKSGFMVAGCRKKYYVSATSTPVDAVMMTRIFDLNCVGRK